MGRVSGEEVVAGFEEAADRLGLVFIDLSGERDGLDEGGLAFDVLRCVRRGDDLGELFLHRFGIGRRAGGRAWDAAELQSRLERHELGAVVAWVLGKAGDE